MNEFRVRKTDDGRSGWVVANAKDALSTTWYISKDGTMNISCVIFNTGAQAQAALNLYKQKQNLKASTTKTMRQFESGATRDANDHPDKPSYYKGLSPIVLREYVKYIGRHRTMSDGSKRDWNNWKNGIPIDVYMDGLLRHVMAVWLIQQGFKSYDNNGEVTLKDSLNGVLFNTTGMLHEILKDEIKQEDKEYYDSILEMIDKKFDK